MSDDEIIKLWDTIESSVSSDEWGKPQILKFARALKAAQQPNIPDTDENWENRVLGADERFVRVAPEQPADLQSVHAAVRQVLKHHRLTEVGDAVVEADLIAAVSKFYLTPQEKQPAEPLDLELKELEVRLDRLPAPINDPDLPDEAIAALRQLAEKIAELEMALVKAKEDSDFDHREYKRLRDELQSRLDAIEKQRGEVAAWLYEYAISFNGVSYENWQEVINIRKPNMPEGSIRNIRPLYLSAPQPTPCEYLVHDKEGTAYCRLAERASVPEGWQLVPKHPTALMMNAFWLVRPYPAKAFTDGYKAMLAAAPPVPEE